MSNQNLEVLASALSAQVERQEQQIAELQKQLADVQKATSCELSSAVIRSAMLSGAEHGAKEAKKVIKNQVVCQKLKQTSR